MKFEALTKTFSKKNLPNSEVELIGEVPYDVVQSYREHALEHIAKELEMPGFRKGHVPQDLALKKVGEVAVLEEAVEHFVRDFYPELIEVHKLDVVGRPNIQLTKLAPGNPVGLTIRAALYPEVTLPKNWREIVQKVPLLPYTGELPKADPPPAPEEEQKAREYMAKSAHRGKIIDALLEKVSVEVPDIFIESELDKIISQMKEDVARFGVKYEDYLKQISKTEEQLRVEFREQAAKRAKLQLTLNKLAADEKVEPDKEAVEAEMKHALEHFPDARPELVRIHIESVLRNEKVLQLLENSEKK